MLQTGKKNEERAYEGGGGANLLSLKDSSAENVAVDKLFQVPTDNEKTKPHKTPESAQPGYAGFSRLF